MATIEDLFAALKAADAAGNTEDATKIAQYLSGLGFGPKVEAEPPKKETGFKDYLKDIPKAVGRGAAGLLETSAIGASALLPEDYEKSARAGIESLAAPTREYLAPSTPEVGESVSSKLLSGVGSTVPFFLMGPAGLAGRLGAGALGVSAGAGEARLGAEQAGATAEERSKATMLGAPVGMLDILAPNIGPLKGLLTTALARGGVEGLTEAAQKVAQNYIAQGIYDPKRDVLEGSAEEGAYGAGVGALTSLLVDIALGRRAKGAAEPQPKAPPAAVETPPAEAMPPALGLPTIQAQTPTPGFSAQEAQDLRQEAEQLEQLRQQAIEQNRLDDLARIEAAMIAQQERVAGMSGFTRMDGNVTIGQVMQERRRAEEEQAMAEAAAAEKQRRAEIRQIEATTFDADPVRNELIKRRELERLGVERATPATPAAPAAPAAPSPLEEPAGLYAKGEPLEAEPQAKPRGAQKFDFTPEEQEEIKSLKSSIAAINKDITAAKAQKTSLFKTLEGRLTVRPGSFNLSDIDPDKASLRKLYKKEGKGALLEDMIEDGALDDFLPPDNRKLVGGQENPRFDSQAAIEHIAGKLRSGDYASEIEAANLQALEQQRDAAKAELEKIQALPQVNRELAEQAQMARTGPSLQDLLDDAANSGVDVEQVQEDVARQMPDATDSEYRLALYNTLMAATNKSLSYEIDGVEYTTTEVEDLIAERFTSDEIDTLIEQTEAKPTTAAQPAAVSRPATTTVPVARREAEAGAEPAVTEAPGKPPVLVAPPSLKLKKGRNEQVVLAARELAAGRITKQQYDQYVDYYMPIGPVMGGSLESPIDNSLMTDILTNKIKQKKKSELINAPIKNGTRVGLRMDIPALEWGRQNGVNGSVVSIHKGTSPDNKTTGPNISYQSTGHIKNVVFAPRDQGRSFGIAQNLEGPKGEKTPQQTVEGDWINTPPEQTFKMVKSLLNDPSWKQISLDPTRHAFFYDRGNRQPVVSADEVLQVGRFVLAKNPVYANRESFMYSLNPDIGTDNLNPADFAGVKNAQELLERYLKVGKDKGLKDLASLLLQSKRLKDVEVNFVKAGDTPKHAGVAASLSANAIAVTHTDKTGSRVYYRADKPDAFNESTLVHEVFHSMTEAALERNPTLRRELTSLTREMRIGLRDFEQLTNKGTNKNLSEFWNIAVRDKPGEMLAYAMTSPAFRQVFSNMAANGRPFQSLSYKDTESLRVRKEKPTKPGEKPAAPKELTAWQRLTDFVRRLLGIPAVNQKKFEQALIDYQQNLKRHEEAQDLYNARLKEYETISPLKGTLDKYLNDLIADTEAVGVAMPQGETVSEIEKEALPYDKAPKSLLGFKKEGPQTPFEETKYKHVEFVRVTFENGEQQLDAIKGLNKAHALARARKNWDGAKVESVPLSVVKKEDPSLVDEAKISSAIFGGKPAAPQPTQLGADAMEMLEGIGRSVAPPEPGYIQKVRQSWDNARDNPQATREAAGGAFRKFADQVETWSFSSDAALNNQIRREVMNSMVGNEQKIGTLLNTSLSQTAHSDAIANLFLMEGNIRYNTEINKWEGVKDDNNIFNLSKKLDEIAEKNGLTKEQIELISHTAFEARRTQGLIDFNANIDAQVEAMRAEAAATRASGKPVAAHALSEKAQALLAKKKVTKNMSPEEIATGLKFFEMFPDLNQVTSIWNGMRENALKVMVDTGLYTDAEANMLLDVVDYVPFYREEQIEEGKGPKEFLRSLSVQADKRLKGSAKPVNDIFDNMVRWTQYAINRGVRNRSAVALATTAEQVGLADRVEDARAGDNVVSVWQDGQRTYYNMHDPLFMSAFRGLESVAIPTVKVFSKMADVLRQSVVLYPLFSIAQVPQDSFAAMFTSGLKPQYALSIPFRAVKEFIQTLRGKSKAHEELKNIGAVGVRDFTSAVIRADAEIFAGLKKDKSLWDSVKRKLGNLAMAADNAVRQATFEAAEAQGLSKAEAYEKAFEIFNVRRRGNSKMLALAGQVIPFFNAYLAAQHVAYRTLTGVGTSPTERKAAFQTLAATTGSVMALSVLYAMMNGDDEDYLNKPTPTRDRLLMIPGSGGFSIPLRADIFALPKVLAEHTYLLLTDNGYEDGAKLRSSMASLLANSIFSPTPVPQAIKPLTEAIINYDFFQQKPLVGVFQQKKELGRQFEDSTSEFSKLLGKTGFVSPIIADHLIRGMFGSFGGLFMYATNPILAEMSGTPRPALSLQDALATIPNASGFVSKEYESALRKDFYALKEVTDRAASTLSDLKQRSPQEIADYLSDETTRQRVALAPAVNQIATKMTNIRRAMTTISQATEDRMDEEEKQRQIKQLREAERQLLQGVNLKRLRELADL